MQPQTVLVRPFTRADLAPVPAGWRVGPPDFVGVGCGKAGSSWWYRLLSEHPRVVPNRVGHKELHYFPHLGWRRPSADELDLYRSAFARPAGHLCGEWSGNYLYYPFALDSLAEAAPAAKLVVLLRNPVDRFASLVNQYAAFRARLIGAAGDGAAILDRWSLFPEAAYQARVADGLARLLSRFPREQLLVVQYERAKLDPGRELARTLRFLGLDDAWRPADASRPVNRNPYVVPRPTPAERARIADWLRDDVERTAALVPELDPELWPEFAPAPAYARTEGA